MTKFSYFLGSEQWQPEDLLKHAEIAREAGFDMLTISEHFHPWVDDYSASNFTWTTLGALANKLPEMDLGTGVTTPLWRIHPGVIAQAAATVDRLSSSTFHLGVGTGENINEGPLGYEFPKYEERKNRLIEALTIIRRLLDGEKLDFNGEYYTTEKAKLYSPPTGNIPIWLAAGGPKSAQVAAEYADGLMISVKDPKDSYERVIDPAKQKSKELKKENLSIHTYRWTMFADNDDDGDGYKTYREITYLTLTGDSRAALVAQMQAEEPLTSNQIFSAIDQDDNGSFSVKLITLEDTNGNGIPNYLDPNDAATLN